MYVTVWINQVKNLDKLAVIINNLRKRLNKVKPTKVKSFKIKVTNIRAQGYFERDIDLTIFDYIGIPIGYVLYHTTKTGDNKLVRTECDLSQLNIKYIKLSYLWSNGIQMYFNGYFSIIAKDLAGLERVTDTIVHLDTLL